MRRLPTVFIAFAVFIVMGAVFRPQQLAPSICAVVFDRRSGEVDVLYGISCPAVIDSAAARSMGHQESVIPPWCDIFGVFSAQDEPAIRARCSEPPG